MRANLLSPLTVWRPCRVVVVPWILCSLACSVPASAGDVRPLQRRGRVLLAEGIDRSPTFRQLVERIAVSDLVVYVDLDPFDERKLDGALQFVARNGDTRVLKVWLRPARCDDEIVVTFGHELQHALEIATAPEIVSQTTFTAFYTRTGRSDHRGRFETQAALDVAVRIRGELHRVGRFLNVPVAPS